MSPRRTGRRQFLRGGAALVGAATMGSRGGAQTPAQSGVLQVKGVRSLAEISRYAKLEKHGYTSPTGSHALTPIQELHGIITPSQLHFYVSHEPNQLLMDIDPQNYRLMIHGMVDRPLILTLDELKRLPSVSRIHYVECGGNSSPTAMEKATNAAQGHGMTSCSEWTGVLVSHLLREAGVRKSASWVITGAADTYNHAKSIPMEKAMDDCLVAYAQNGEPVRLDMGYPVRLVCPGWTGKAHVKWLNQLKVVDEPYLTLQDGSADAMRLTERVRALGDEVYAKSVITFPSGGQKLPGRGYYEITGLAWTGSGKVRRVEISTDGGRTWKDAQLQEPILSRAHTRFRFAWSWNGEEAVLQSRCTDERGNVQPSVAEQQKRFGSDSSRACRNAFGEACQRVETMAESAYIQSWRVERDGSVRNAFKAPGSAVETSEVPLEIRRPDVHQGQH